ncbi:MAG: O-antigen ligase family protein, partial [Bacteroidota bacterium]
MKFNYSSMLFIFFTASSIILYFNGILERLKRIHIIHIIVFAGTYLLLVISLVYSENVAQGLKKIVQLLPLLITPIVLIYFSPKGIKSLLPYFLSFYLASNLIYGLILIDYLTMGHGMEWTKHNFWEVMATLFENGFNKTEWDSKQLVETNFLMQKAYMSMSFLMALCISSSRMLNMGPTRIWFWLYLFLSFYFLLLLFYLLSIPNILTLFICMAIMPIFYYSKIDKKIIMLFYVAFLALSSIAYYHIAIKEAGNQDLERGLNFIQSVFSFSRAEYNDPRIEIYKSSWEIVKDNPILGIGLGDTQDALNSVHRKRLQENFSNIKNKLDYSEEFNENIWYKGNIQVEHNVAKAPNGSITADRIMDTPVTSGHTISQMAKLEANSLYTLSVFVKSQRPNYLILRLGNITRQRVNFDLGNPKAYYKGDLIEDQGIEDVGGGWYRCH